MEDQIHLKLDLKVQKIYILSGPCIKKPRGVSVTRFDYNGA